LFSFLFGAMNAVSAFLSFDWHAMQCDVCYRQGHMPHRPKSKGGSQKFRRKISGILWPPLVRISSKIIFLWPELWDKKGWCTTDYMHRVLTVSFFLLFCFQSFHHHHLLRNTSKHEHKIEIINHKTYKWKRYETLLKKLNHGLNKSLPIGIFYRDSVRVRLQQLSACNQFSLEVRGEIIRTVLCCTVYWSCAQS